MKGRVLIVNQNDMPLSIHEMDRAMLLWDKNKAGIVEVYDDQFFDVFGEKIGLPAVMRMNYFVKINKKRPLRDFYSKVNIWKRDGGRCQYCGRKVSVREFTVDHIIPRCKGGQSIWTNIVTACKKCNNKKDCKTLKEAGMKLIKRPVVPDIVETVCDNIRHKFLNLDRVDHPSWYNYIK